MTAFIVEEEVGTILAPTEPGDHDKFAHYVPNDEMAMAMVTGTPLRALCGKMWVPTSFGSDFPVCPDCKDAYEKLESD